MEQLDETQVELLRLVEHGRDTPTLQFLFREHRPDAAVEIDAALGSMQAQGWVVLDSAGRHWERTAAGEEVLRANDHWVFLVEKVFPGQPHPTATGLIRSGTVHSGDSFVVDGADSAAVGQVVNVIQIGRGEGRALGLSGLVPAAGDILRRLSS